MYFVDNGSAVPVMPQVKPVSSATPQFFTEGGNGTPPTYPGPDWFNIVQTELLNLNHELTLLAIENKNLNNEVESLSAEVMRLQQHISNNSNYDELPNDSRSIQ